MFGQRRRAGTRLPKPPKRKKPQKPKVKELTDAYRQYVSGNIETRVTALAKALKWWDQAIEYFIFDKPLNAKQVKLYGLSNKTRTLGARVESTEPERELALVRTIEMYQKIWTSAPSFNSHKAKFESVRVRLEQKQKQVESRHRFVLESLNETFESMGVKFVVSKSDVARQFDGSGTILINPDLTKVLGNKARREGVLPVLFSEAFTVLKAAAIERNTSGDAVLNLERFAKLVPVMLGAILTHCGKVERAKVFKLCPETVEAKVDTEVKSRDTSPRTGGGGSGPKRTRKGPKVGGRYMPGSAMAMVYERLADQKPHPLSQVLDGIPVSNPMDRLKWLQKHGVQTKDWTVEISGNTVQMTLHVTV